MPKKTAQPKLHKKIRSKISIPKPSLSVVPILTVVFILFLSLFAYTKWATNMATIPPENQNTTDVQVVAAIDLPKPTLKSNFSIEAAIFTRRSRRDFTEDPLTIKQVGQMLWSAQGVTADWGGRTTPSAKSAYPLTVYLIVNNVEDLESGLYRYIPGDREPLHQIVLEKSGNLKETVFNAIGQASVKETPATIIITGNMEKMSKAFDNQEHDENVYLEAGHAAQNLYLQAESLGLGMVTLAGFNPNNVRSVLSIPETETIIYAIPFGIPKK